MIGLVVLGCLIQLGCACMCFETPAESYEVPLAEEFCNRPMDNVVKAKVEVVVWEAPDHSQREVVATIEKVWGKGDAQVGNPIKITADYDYEDYNRDFLIWGDFLYGGDRYGEIPDNFPSHDSQDWWRIIGTGPGAAPGLPADHPLHGLAKEFASLGFPPVLPDLEYRTHPYYGHLCGGAAQTLEPGTSVTMWYYNYRGDWDHYLFYCDHIRFRDVSEDDLDEMDVAADFCENIGE